MSRQPGAVKAPISSEQHAAAIELEVRRHLARELHDRVAQTLTGMLVDVENFKAQETGWDDVVQHLDTVQTSTRQVLASIRQLLHDLRGERQDAVELLESLRALLSGFTESTHIAADLAIRPGWPARLNRRAALNLYRIAEEALANVRMHSRAHNVRIILDPVSESQLSMMIHDDGFGIDLDPARPVGLGIVGMKERAMLLGGSLRIKRTAGRGTAILVVFPRAGAVREMDDRATNSLMIRENITA